MYSLSWCKLNANRVDWCIVVVNEEGILWASQLLGRGWGYRGISVDIRHLNLKGNCIC